MADTLPARLEPVEGPTTGSPVYYSYPRTGTSRTGGYSAPPAETPPPPLNTKPGRIGRVAGNISRYSGIYRQYGNVPHRMPRFMASRSMLFMFWFLAMILVASDEWQKGFKFPRPPRLWWASVTFFVLFLVSQSDRLVALCNAVGGGFVVALLYENVSGNSLSLFGVSVTGNTSSAGSDSAGSDVTQTSTGNPAGWTWNSPALNPYALSQVAGNAVGNLGANTPSAKS